MADKKHIAIIGAGISGLLACKYALSKNFQPIVFESQTVTGGLWTKTLSTTKLQTPKPAFQFSDFPWPDSVTTDYPTHDQILHYIQSYAQRFDLIKHIQFNTRVIGISYKGASSDEEMEAWGKWEVEVSRGASLQTEVYEVGFVILCVGKYSEVPNVPKFATGKGPEAFQGKVIHSMEYSDMGEHWNLPDYMPWGFPLAYLYFNLEKGSSSVFWPPFFHQLWAISKFVESDIKHRHHLAKHGMVPKHGFIQDISSCLIATVPEKFFDKVEKGSIVMTKSPSFSFCKEGITIEGFKGEKKLQDIFRSKQFSKLIVGSPNAALPLYRDCIPPRIPQLAVLGFSESLSNLFTSELLDGRFKLPEIKEMEKDAARWDGYLKEYGGEYYKRSCIGALHIWHNDQLCKDMGWNPRRKSGLWAELFEPYGPLDYVSP
ncbi:Probable flavin-containing monooxygenase 1 [Linum perenne]